MQHLRISSPAHLTDEVMAVFTGDPAVSHLAVLRGASVEPAGDIVLADVLPGQKAARNKTRLGSPRQGPARRACQM